MSRNIKNPKSALGEINSAQDKDFIPMMTTRDDYDIDTDIE